MNRTAAVIARFLLSTVFLLNGFGVIDQSIPARELAERGVPSATVPAVMLGGRVLEVAAGAALAFGVAPQLAALALLAFLVPATFVSHSFWEAWRTAAFQPQMINFFKNFAIWGGLLFTAGAPRQPAVVSSSALLSLLRFSRSRRPQ